MLRVIARFIGLLLLAAAFAALVVDGTKSIASDTLIVTPLAQIAQQVAPSKFPLLQGAIESRFGHFAWKPVATTLLALPGWLIAGAFGGLLFAATRRRVVRIGYSSRG
ncbi:MAG: hypothetical protein U1E30_14480 [Rhodoblastus sp.]|jgi:hypothetical protein